MVTTVQSGRGKSVTGGGPSRRVLAASLALHAALLVIVLLVPAEALRPRSRPDEVAVVFHRPRPRPVEAAPRIVPPPPMPKEEATRPRPAPVATPPPAPIPPPPRRQAPPPEPVRKNPAPEPPPPAAVPAPEPVRPVVRTNVFRDTAAQPPAAKPAASPPRTGTFGAAAARAEPPPPRNRSVAATGFAAAEPASAARPAPAQDRAPVKVGFDGAAAAEPAPAHRPSGAASVKQGQFGDAVVVRETRPSREASPGRPDTPVEIVSKPRPSYTDEARRLKIEGEVVLEVIFVSTGKLRILGVLQKLGHGLDEAAIEAARNIEFKPARRDGKPIDHTARLHIVFQLA